MSRISNAFFGCFGLRNRSGILANETANDNDSHIQMRAGSHVVLRAESVFVAGSNVEHQFVIHELIAMLGGDLPLNLLDALVEELDHPP